MNEELYWEDHIDLVATKNIENDMNEGDVAANTSEAIYDNDLELASDDTLSREEIFYGQESWIVYSTWS